MPICQRCREETEALVRVKSGRKTLKLCEDCADEVREEAEVGAEAEQVMRGMMEYKGRR